MSANSTNASKLTLERFMDLWRTHLPDGCTFEGSDHMLRALNKAADGDFSDFAAIERKLAEYDKRESIPAAPLIRTCPPGVCKAKSPQKCTCIATDSDMLCAQEVVELIGLVYGSRNVSVGRDSPIVAIIAAHARAAAAKMPTPEGFGSWMSSIRWMLNMSSERPFMQAATMFDKVGDTKGVSHRAHLEAMWAWSEELRKASPQAAQKWVPIADRLPAESDADCDGKVWIWAPFYIPAPGSRADDEEREYVIGGYKAFREFWDHVRSQKPTHWMPSRLRRPEDPSAQEAKS